MSDVSTSISFLKIEELAWPLFLVTFTDGVRMNYEMVEQTRRAYDGLSERGKIRLIVDMIGVKQVDKDARKSLSDKHSEERIEAMAILVRDPISRMIGNFLIGLNKPTVPLKLFSDFDSARNWIES